MKHIPLVVYLFLILLPLPGRAAGFDLNFQRLAESLRLISTKDRQAVEEAVELVRRGENMLALVKLTALSKTNPNNSSVRIATAWALLQAGNLLGAFEEAKKAEAAPDGNSYKCWFLAKVAWLSGNKQVCRHELKHVKAAGDMAAEVKSFENEIKGK